MDRLNLAINIYLKHLEARAGEIKERYRNFTDSNLSSDEQDALKKLKGYRDIIIKEADEGGAAVGWNRNDYCEEACMQLHDDRVYELIEKFGIFGFLC